ncbi:hypothetical protein DQ04_24181000 [Trypanosoma grayi]|uniref:hypothetical protein n=1 Tax=Trypanosoma grayi TaxID=71804 RepID=UPI0004F45C0E|nr:hypothetical protein DQ04_24181000 [Trypanosoma grayi]KEG05278.1 hypothetical protein DQ04_24181000 [Trypanosoma grayi]
MGRKKRSGGIAAATGEQESKVHGHSLCLASHMFSLHVSVAITNLYAQTHTTHLQPRSTTAEAADVTKRLLQSPITNSPPSLLSRTHSQTDILPIPPLNRLSLLHHVALQLRAEVHKDARPSLCSAVPTYTIDAPARTCRKASSPLYTPPQPNTNLSWQRRLKAPTLAKALGNTYLPPMPPNPCFGLMTTV